MSNVERVNIRAIIDEITLDVAQAQSSESLEQAISDRAVAHIRSMIDGGSLTDDEDIDRVTQAIVSGVVKRLLQIAESGGQMRSA